MTGSLHASISDVVKKVNAQREEKGRKKLTLKEVTSLLEDFGIENLGTANSIEQLEFSLDSEQKMLSQILQQSLNGDIIHLGQDDNHEVLLLLANVAIGMRHQGDSKRSPLREQVLSARDKLLDTETGFGKTPAGKSYIALENACAADNLLRMRTQIKAYKELQLIKKQRDKIHAGANALLVIDQYQSASHFLWKSPAITTLLTIKEQELTNRTKKIAKNIEYLKSSETKEGRVWKKLSVISAEEIKIAADKTYLAQLQAKQKQYDLTIKAFFKIQQGKPLNGGESKALTAKLTAAGVPADIYTVLSHIEQSKSDAIDSAQLKGKLKTELSTLLINLHTHIDKLSNKSRHDMGELRSRQKENRRDKKLLEQLAVLLKKAKNNKIKIEKHELLDVLKTAVVRVTLNCQLEAENKDFLMNIGVASEYQDQFDVGYTAEKHVALKETPEQALSRLQRDDGSQIQGTLSYIIRTPQELKQGLETFREINVTEDVTQDLLISNQGAMFYSIFSFFMKIKNEFCKKFLDKDNDDLWQALSDEIKKAKKARQEEHVRLCQAMLIQLKISEHKSPDALTRIKQKLTDADVGDIDQLMKRSGSLKDDFFSYYVEIRDLVATHCSNSLDRRHMAGVSPNETSDDSDVLLKAPIRQMWTELHDLDRFKPLPEFGELGISQGLIEELIETELLFYLNRLERMVSLLSSPKLTTNGRWQLESKTKLPQHHFDAMELLLEADKRLDHFTEKDNLLLNPQRKLLQTALSEKLQGYRRNICDFRALVGRKSQPVEHRITRLLTLKGSGKIILLPEAVQELEQDINECCTLAKLAKDCGAKVHVDTSRLIDEKRHYHQQVVNDLAAAVAKNTIERQTAINIINTFATNKEQEQTVADLFDLQENTLDEERFDRFKKHRKSYHDSGTKDAFDEDIIAPIAERVFEQHDKRLLSKTSIDAYFTYAPSGRHVGWCKKSFPTDYLKSVKNGTYNLKDIIALINYLSLFKTYKEGNSLFIKYDETLGDQIERFCNEKEDLQQILAKNLKGVTADNIAAWMLKFYLERDLATELVKKQLATGVTTEEDTDEQFKARIEDVLYKDICQSLSVNNKGRFCVVTETKIKHILRLTDSRRNELLHIHIADECVKNSKGVAMDAAYRSLLSDEQRALYKGIYRSKRDLSTLKMGHKLQVTVVKSHYGANTEKFLDNLTAAIEEDTKTPQLKNMHDFACSLLEDDALKSEFFDAMKELEEATEKWNDNFIKQQRRLNIKAALEACLSKNNTKEKIKDEIKALTDTIPLNDVDVYFNEVVDMISEHLWEKGLRANVSLSTLQTKFDGLLMEMGLNLAERSKRETFLNKVDAAKEKIKGKIDSLAADKAYLTGLNKALAAYLQKTTQPFVCQNNSVFKLLCREDMLAFIERVPQQVLQDISSKLKKISAAYPDNTLIDVTFLQALSFCMTGSTERMYKSQVKDFPTAYAFDQKMRAYAAAQPPLVAVTKDEMVKLKDNWYVITASEHWQALASLILTLANKPRGLSSLPYNPQIIVAAHEFLIQYANSVEIKAAVDQYYVAIENYLMQVITQSVPWDNVKKQLQQISTDLLSHLPSEQDEKNKALQQRMKNAGRIHVSYNAFMKGLENGELHQLSFSTTMASDFRQWLSSENKQQLTQAIQEAEKKYGAKGKSHQILAIPYQAFITAISQEDEGATKKLDTYQTKLATIKRELKQCQAWLKNPLIDTSIKQSESQGTEDKYPSQYFEWFLKPEELTTLFKHALAFVQQIKPAGYEKVPRFENANGLLTLFQDLAKPSRHLSYWKEINKIKTAALNTIHQLDHALNNKSARMPSPERMSKVAIQCRLLLTKNERDFLQPMLTSMLDKMVEKKRRDALPAIKALIRYMGSKTHDIVIEQYEHYLSQASVVKRQVSMADREDKRVQCGTTEEITQDLKHSKKRLKEIEKTPSKLCDQLKQIQHIDDAEKKATYFHFIANIQLDMANKPVNDKDDILLTNIEELKCKLIQNENKLDDIRHYVEVAYKLHLINYYKNKNRCPGDELTKNPWLSDAAKGQVIAQSLGAKKTSSRKKPDPPFKKFNRYVAKIAAKSLNDLFNTNSGSGKKDGLPDDCLAITGSNEGTGQTSKNSCG